MSPPGLGGRNAARPDLRTWLERAHAVLRPRFVSSLLLLVLIVGLVFGMVRWVL